MKRKLVSVLMAGVMVLALAACGGSGASSTSSEPAADAGAAATGEAAAESGGSYAAVPHFRHDGEIEDMRDVIICQTGNEPHRSVLS